MSEDSSRAVLLPQARSYLRKADLVLARLIDERPDFDPRAWMTELPPMDLYGALLFQVTGRSCPSRRPAGRWPVEALFGGHLPEPAELLAVEPSQLRQAGLSWRKINTLRDLAQRLTDGRLDQDVLSTLPDDELLAELTAISGIGPWTVQGAMLSRCSARTSSCLATWRFARPSGPPISWATCPARTRSWLSRRNGGPTAAWPRATCSPPPSSRLRRHQPPGTVRRSRAQRPDGPDGRDRECAALNSILGRWLSTVRRQQYFGNARQSLTREDGAQLGGVLVRILVECRFKIAPLGGGRVCGQLPRQLEVPLDGPPSGGQESAGRRRQAGVRGEEPRLLAGCAARCRPR